MSQLHLLSGGAAFGLVSQLQGQFAADTGCQVVGTYNAVGVMLDQLLAGTPCDVVILTAALIQQLEASGHVVAGSARQLGVVKTGVAVKAGATPPQVDTPEQLKTALLAATGIYFPDPVKATAGIHFMRVLKQLGIDTELASRLRPFPNGATAMGEMARIVASGVVEAIVTGNTSINVASIAEVVRLGVSQGASKIVGSQVVVNVLATDEKPVSDVVITRADGKVLDKGRDLNFITVINYRRDVTPPQPQPSPS